MMSSINPLVQTICSDPAMGLPAIKDAFNKCKNELFERPLSPQLREKADMCVFSSLLNDIISDQSLSEKVANATLATLRMNLSMKNCQDLSRAFDLTIKNVPETIPINDKITDAVSSFFREIIYANNNPKYSLMIDHEFRKFPRAPHSYSNRENVIYGCGIVVAGLALVTIYSLYSLYSLLTTPAAAPLPLALAPAAVPAAVPAALHPAAAPAPNTPTNGRTNEPLR